MSSARDAGAEGTLEPHVRVQQQQQQQQQASSSQHIAVSLPHLPPLVALVAPESNDMQRADLAFQNDMLMLQFLSTEERLHLARMASAWALCNGLILRASYPVVPPSTGNASGDGDHSVVLSSELSVAEPAPVSLIPAPLPKVAYSEAVALAPIFNRLMLAVSRDDIFVDSVSASVGTADHFTARLRKIHCNVYQHKTRYFAAIATNDPKPEEKTEEDLRPVIEVAVLRSDYMVHVGAPSVETVNQNTLKPPAIEARQQAPVLRLMQVEINTISAAFCGLSPRVTELHKYLAIASKRYSVLANIPQPKPQAESGACEPKGSLENSEGISKKETVEEEMEEEEEDEETYNSAGSRSFTTLARLPRNDATQAVANALALAHKEYGVKNGVIMFVVQELERNVFDQHALEFELTKVHGIQVIRRTLRELASGPYSCRHSQDCTKNGKLPRLLVSTPVEGQADPSCREVSVVYWRTGYAPSDYQNESAWQVRELIELSCCAKCPSIAMQLAGTKRMQQKLSEPGVLEAFGLSSVECAKARRCFAEQVILDNTGSGRSMLEHLNVPGNAENYVLKPQREGGGNNIYGSEIVNALTKMNAEERSAYVLMERIFPPATRSLFLHKGRLVDVKAAVSELGVYSVIVAKQGKTILNSSAGHLLRTKPVTSNEGGVAAGFAVLDSPALYS